MLALCGSCLVTDVATTITAIASTVGLRSYGFPRIHEEFTIPWRSVVKMTRRTVREHVLTSRQTARVKNNVGSGRAVCYRAAWIWRRNYPLPARLGGCKGSLELPKSILICYARSCMTSIGGAAWFRFWARPVFEKGKEANDLFF